ncbi:MAG TPA: hypothetical protein VJ572_05700 [Azonexus sp.]|nr:hypothetical protein [Azonexus sp.]
MKSNTLRKSGLGLLILAGTMVPMAASAEEGTQYGHQTTTMERGDQGAIRTESMSSDPTNSASVLYPELTNIHSPTVWSANRRGAQGPVRTDSMDTSPSYKASELYFDLKNIQRSE